MTDQDKKIHDLKFELRQQKERIDILEQTVEKLAESNIALMKGHEKLILTVGVLSNAILASMEEGD